MPRCVAEENICGSNRLVVCSPRLVIWEFMIIEGGEIVDFVA